MNLFSISIICDWVQKAAVFHTKNWIEQSDTQKSAFISYANVVGAFDKQPNYRLFSHSNYKKVNCSSKDTNE